MSITIAFVKETAAGERRAALSPETCKKLLANDTALKYLKISYTSAAKDAEELDTAHLKEFTAPAP